MGTCLAATVAALLLGAGAAQAKGQGGELTLRAPALSIVPRAAASTASVAEPQDLTIRLDEGAEVVTGDDYEHGITLTNFTGGSVTVDAAGASVRTSGTGALGVVAIAADGNATVHIGDVHTTGVEGHGIVAGAPFGSVEVKAGTVTTEGDLSFGIRANAYQGAVDVTAVGVETAGYYAGGVAASSNGNVHVDVGSVKTGGDMSTGIDVKVGQPPLYDYDTGETTLSPPADLTVRAGTVETSGYRSDGVIATNFTMGETSVDVGSIKTGGDNSWGAYAGGFGNVSLTVGSVDTSGDGSVGLGAVSFYGNIDVSAGSVVTRGDFATGVNVLNYDLNRATSITVGDVRTEGAGSTGIYMAGAYFEGNEGQAITITAGSVETRGVGSTGVAVLTGGDVTLDLGSVTVEGNRSRGVVISGGQGDLTLTVDSIVTKGQSQFGRDTSGLVIANNHGAVNATIGSIETSGDFSPAILSNGYNSDQRFTVTGGLRTSGYYASAFQANIYNGSLTLDAAAISTKGGSSSGVRVGARSSDIDIRTGSVTTEGDFSAGISVETASYDGTGHRIDIDGGTIVTKGHYSNGIDALALGADANVTAASITTSGNHSSGVRAVALSGFDEAGNPFGGNVTVDVGTVVTTGDDAPGIDTIAIGTTTIRADKVTTSGSNSAGIKAYGYGDIVIDAGTVETHGYRSDGISANNNVGGLSGNIKITAGAVTTSGDGSTGIRGTAYYGSTTIKAGSVKTGGTGADAIYGWSYFGDTMIDVESVATTGDGGRGIVAYSGGTTTVIAGDVSTSGKGTSSEFHAGAIKAVGAAVHVEAGSVSTKGDFSTAIYANSNMIADNGQVPRDITVRADSISTEGFASHGVVAINNARRAGTVIDVGDVKTGGDYAVGVYALAPASDISIKAKSVETGGKASVGVVAISNYGNIAVDVGTVVTAGEGSHGIYSYSGGPARSTGSTIIKAGSITTSGDGASGVVAIGAGRDNSLSIDVGSVSTQGTGARGIFGYSLGDISVTAGNIATRGDGAAAIEAFSFHGDIDVAAGKISTLGDLAVGIYASTLTGNVVIEAGDISTKGLLSQGVRAFSAEGDVTVTTSGAISTEGDYAYGALAFGGGEISIINKGNVTTQGYAAHGLYALGRADGTTTVTNSGAIKVSGEAASGIRAIGAGGEGVKIVSTGTISAAGENSIGILGNVPRGGRGSDRDAVVRDGAPPGLDIDAASVTVSGLRSSGIVGLNYQGDVRIKAGTVKVNGGGTGIFAIANGAIDVEAGNIASDGRGVLLMAGDAATLNVTGTIVTPNHVAIEMNAFAGQAVLNIAKNATVVGGGLRNPADDPYVGPGNTIIIGSDAGAVINNAGTIRNLGDRYTIFVTDSHLYSDLPGVAVGVQIGNSGLIEGNMRLTTGDDVVTNSGVFVATKDSVFGDGDDRFVNSGILKVAPAAPAGNARAPSGSNVTFAGLERFENSGLIDMRGGGLGDTLTLPGSFAGSGQSTLALDVGIGNADKLVVTGAATGHTSIVLAVDPKAAKLTADPVDIVQVGAGSSADAFTLADPDIGFIRYGMRYDTASGTYSLTSRAGASVYRLAKLGEGAQAIWNQSAGAWSTHMAQLRDADGGLGRLWGQMYGNVVNRDGAVDGGRADYRQDFFGGQLGYDVGGTESDEGGFVFGVTGSYLNSRQRFKDGGEEARFDSVGLGGYGRYRSGRFFANLLTQYAHYSATVRHLRLDADWSDKIGGDAFGVQGEIGMRLGGDGLFAEPAVSLAWQSSSLGTIEAFEQTLDFDSYKTLTGRIGLRAGGAVDLGGGAKGIFYARGNYVRQLDGKGGLLFGSGGVTEAVRAPRAGDYGEVALGLNILSEGPVSGFIEGDATVGSGAKGGGGRVGIRFKF